MPTKKKPQKYKTSKCLESIVQEFELDLLQVIEGCFSPGFLLRFSFRGKNDQGSWFHAGEGSYQFDLHMSPRDFANSLRATADQLDEYWARAFPTAITKEGENEHKAKR